MENGPGDDRVPVDFFMYAPIKFLDLLEKYFRLVLLEETWTRSLIDQLFFQSIHIIKETHSERGIKQWIMC